MLPFGDVLADDELIVAGEVASYAELGGGMQVFAQVGNHGVVAEGGLDEKLSLVVHHRPAFQVLDGILPFGTLDGQVAVEGEGLTVESRSHQG